MPRPGDVHVIPAGGEWATEVEGQSGRSTYPTRDKAIRVGRKLAADNRSELLIHWRDPHISESNGNGPGGMGSLIS